jgi:hypothetical protein
MSDKHEDLVLAFHGGYTYALVRSQHCTFSVFGGPYGGKIGGKRFGPSHLHHIACLAGYHCGLTFGDLPLLYGMRYDGCQLTYKVGGYSNITVLEMSPRKSSADWPYVNYPAILPYVPLEVGKRKKQSWRKFAEAFPNLPDDQPCELVVVVPPPLTTGVSLWGPQGDATRVAIVFECNVEAEQVTAYNVCD